MVKRNGPVTEDLLRRAELAEGARLGSTGKADVAGEAWHDVAEAERRESTAARVAERLHEERGVEEPVRVVAGHGALWVEYGLLRLRVAGEGAEVTTEAELFDDVDVWAAFDREAGPGRVLDRDRDVVAGVLARMPAAMEFWTGAVQRVLSDLHATTHLRWHCSLRVQEDEPQWPVTTSGAGVHLSAAVLDVAPVEGENALDPWASLPRRALSLPRLWLDSDAGWGITVDESEDDLEAACAEAADKVSDEAVEELHRAWPACPHHVHPLESRVVGGVACWACPTLPDVRIAIGTLGRP